MTDKNQLSGKRVYEHPFSERMRLLLRLEIVFEQALKHKTASDQYETQFCLDALFALLNLTNRFELRAELLRELDRIKNFLIQQQRFNLGTDDEEIETLLSELNDTATMLHALDTRHIENTRNTEFLSTVKNRNVHDTGNYLFELPALQHWLSQPASHRERQIDAWLKDFMPLKNAIDFLLRLVREHAAEENVVAENGVYIKKVDGRSSSYQLLRVILPENAKVYPRVSGDRYRFAVRFMEQKQVDERAVQAEDDVHFILKACGI